MLSVVMTCGINLSQSCKGKSRSVVANAKINASLNVCIAHLAAFTRWLCGLTSWSLHLSSVRKIFICFVA
jgi:hypothetical protein